MSGFLAHIADQLLNRPLLVTPDKAQVIMAVLAGRIGVEGADASRFEGSPIVADGGGKMGVRPYNVAGGVAVITITGSLVNRGAWVGANSGLTSYEGIQHQLKTAAADPAVKAIILDLHTTGGQATGAFETAAMVRQVAATKPVVALVAGMAASAGYAIASGATEIVTTETGISGSIGVVFLHADFSKQLAKDGVTPTLIIAGAHKADGNPFEPLSKEVRAGFQEEVDGLYSLFLATVARGRGARFDAAAARSTEARVFMGEKAVAVGLADRMGTFESVLAELQAGRNLRAATSRASVAPVAGPAAIVPAAVPVAAARPVDPVMAGRRAEYDASASLRALWPDFGAYAAFLTEAEKRALARKGGVMDPPATDNAVDRLAAATAWFRQHRAECFPSVIPALRSRFELSAIEAVRVIQAAREADRRISKQADTG